VKEVHTEDPEILGATMKHVVATTTWHTRLVPACVIIIVVILRSIFKEITDNFEMEVP
jgi:hypothetical protein